MCGDLGLHPDPIDNGLEQVNDDDAQFRGRTVRSVRARCKETRSLTICVAYRHILHLKYLKCASI